MACGIAVKRPHDYEAYLAGGSESPEGPSEAKRHCPPFRAQLGTIAASLPVNSSALLNKSSDSPFAAVATRCQLTGSQLDAFLRAEIRYLRRRRVIPRRCSVEASTLQPGEPPFKQTNYRAAPKSPQSGSDSDSESTSSQVAVKTSSSPLSKAEEGSRSTPSPPAAVSTLADRPQFTLRQVQLICERLLKEQEIRLRSEFEVALNHRLEEQHEQYVQFAEEQLATRRAEVAGGECFYLS